jgi:hypothetical protein
MLENIYQTAQLHILEDTDHFATEHHSLLGSTSAL